jgi:predicted  nucleic acid-binding Zn-ribbon protein
MKIIHAEVRPLKDRVLHVGLPLDVRVAIALMVGVLSVALIVLALTHRGETKTEPRTTVVRQTVADTALRREVAALKASLASVHATTAASNAAVAKLGATTKDLQNRLEQLRSAPSNGAALAELGALVARLQTVNECLFELQKQLDDLQGYALTRKALHKRVAGQCLQILRPRYAGR